MLNFAIAFERNPWTTT